MTVLERVSDTWWSQSVTEGLQHLAIVGSSMLDCPSEDGSGQESAEVLFGAETLRESWTHNQQSISVLIDTVRWDET